MVLHASNLSSFFSSPSSSSLPAGFTLTAPFPSDIWRKPPAHDAFTAPIVYRAIPIRSFKSARVSVVGEWKTLYDQGGIIIVFPRTESAPLEARRWVKAGIEHYGGRPRMSVVAAAEWADWSLCELGTREREEGKVTVEFERTRKELGEGAGWSTVLRVSTVDSYGERAPVREITWAFHDLEEEEEMWIGVYAAKPTKDERGSVEVQFDGFEVEERAD